MPDSDYRWLNEVGSLFLSRDYLPPGQELDSRVDIICNTAEERLQMPGFAARFKANLKKGWYSLASPIWTNFGTERGLPISCFGSHIEDNMESILRTHSEIGIMSKYGGGTSAYCGEIRGRGMPIKGGLNGLSAGSVNFMELYDKEINIVSQGSSRRGQCACYLPIDHPDIEEFLSIRREGHPIQSLSTGVCVSRSWNAAMKAGDPDKRRIWAKVLDSRKRTGYPYIFWTDNANDGAPKVYRERGMKIRHSNLCTEIMLPDNDEESFVCDLSSMNLLYFREWQGTDAVQLLMFFLDAVMSEFIAKATGRWGMERAVRFAERHRALGMGVLGWHSYLQANLIPFESAEAMRATTQIFRYLQKEAEMASSIMAAMYGEPEYCRGTGYRNTTWMAIAPTKSSSFILGQVSEGVEPIRGNIYIRDTQKGKFTIKNPALTELLEHLGQNTPAVWDEILRAGGSVQGLSFLEPRYKDVFKTFQEISPMAVVAQAAHRQKWIDQGQSINLVIHPSIPTKDVNAVYMAAEELGLKSLYYQISANAAQEFARNITTCVACEG